MRASVFPIVLVVFFCGFASPEFLKPLSPLGFLKKDSNYYVQEVTPSLNIILSSEFKPLYPLPSSRVKIIDSKLSELFQIRPYFRKNNIFFSSPRFQISNATAQVVPMPFIRMYPSSNTDFLDFYSLLNWSEDVLLHEMSHIYQFSQNNEWDRFFWPVLGALSYRNQFLPRWVMEGHSVLIESLYGSGGRLWSGFVRALVFAQIKENKISLKKLFRPRNSAFYGDEIYFHGAYFWAYLDFLYGLKSFDWLQNSSKILPIDYYGVNFSFKKTFGKNLKQIFQDYKEHYEAKNQKSLKAQPLFKSQGFAPLNSDKESLYFLISDLKSPAWIIVFDKKTKQFKKQRSNLPFGKLFKKEGRFVSSASLQSSYTSKEYTLVEENFKAIPDYNSQLVMDIKEDQTLSLNTQSSLEGNAILLNKRFYDWTHSSALMDSKGSVYYFKQNGNLRSLYKDKKKLVSFESYFSYPVEADSKGLYFISASPYGSSLFVYDNKKIYRLSDSDRIVFARKINDEEFLVSEIGAEQFEYKILKAKKSLDQPFLYQYSFKKENLFDKAPKLKERPEFKSLTVQTESYRPLNHLLLSRFLFSWIADTKWRGLDGRLQFTDPLSYNVLSFASEIKKNKNDFFNSFFFSYSYRKYRPYFKLSAYYNKSFLEITKDSAQILTLIDLGFLNKEMLFVKSSEGKPSLLKDRIETQDRMLSFSADYPLYQNSQSQLLAWAGLDLGQKRFFAQNKFYPWRDYTKVGVGLSYEFERSYPLSYSYQKRRFLDLDYSLLSRGNRKPYFMLETRGEWERNLGRQLFLSFGGRMFLGHLDRKPFFIPLREGILYSSFEEGAKDFYQADLSLLKAFNRSYSSLWNPFSIRRWAASSGLSLFSFKKHREKNFEELFSLIFVGLEGQFVFSDKISFSSGFKMGAVMNPHKNFSPYFSFWLKGSDLYKSFL